jgi:hypothetical protein
MVGQGHPGSPDALGSELVELLWQARERLFRSAQFSKTPVDGLDDRWYQDRASALDLVGISTVRNQTIRRVEALPERAFEEPQFYPWLGEDPLWKWIATDSFEHESEHEQQVRTWRIDKGV